MNKFCSSSLILCIGLGVGLSSVTAEPLTDLTELGEQCGNHDASKSSREATGHALLQSSKSVKQVSVSGSSQAQAVDNLDMMTVEHLELAKLSVDLSEEQVKQMLDLARSMRKNNKDPYNGHGFNQRSTQLNQLAENATQPVHSLSGPDDPDMIKSHLGDIPPTLPDSFRDHTEEQHDRTHDLAKFIVVPLSSVFFVVYNLNTWMEKYEITAIPESGIVIALGIILGFFMKKYSSMDFFEDDEAWAELNSWMLNLMLLPVIIFASGWTLRRQDFFSQFPYILLFAVGGTAISTSIVAGLINWTGTMGYHSVLGWRTAFCYASLISATDPVATLSTYSKLKVQPLLNIMVFGESTINDAVAIVLFKVFNADVNFVDPATGAPLMIGVPLLYNVLYGVFKGFLGSLILGVLLGMLYTLIARACDMRQNKKGQILVIFVSCYLTYAIAESVHLSGIIAEIFCSLVMGVYMRPHLSSDGCALATFFMEEVAALADSAVFLLVGVSVTQLTTKGWYIGLWIMLFCLIGRFCATVPIALFVNFLKASKGTMLGIEKEGWNLLSASHIFMMWHGGLRGGIALALAWELGKWVDVAEGPGTRKALQTATFLVIVAFLAVFGGSTSFALKRLGIPMGTDEPEDTLSKTETSGTVHGFLGHLDEKILTPMLIGDESK